MTDCYVVETGELLMIDKAKEIGDTLVKRYPGHLWCVQPMGDGFSIKNLSISGAYGFYMHNNITYSASHLSKRAVLAGGELLERAGMRRGLFNGEFAQTLEGAPKFRPA